ncbi:MAG: protein-L-isoaspartate(D-aspartate) O-methyltransferase [Chloroflexota bacterium]|nr:protein-L-isoaspartate(D-aspartate) O-methyltransferase [Chloroflexota bacterium]
MLRLVRRSVTDPRIIEAMEAVPRERFVAPELRSSAYDDAALPIGEAQTISQPLMVAILLAALQLRSSDRVLEVGTGSGYQAALLSRLASEVITVERVPALTERARAVLAGMGCNNVKVFQSRDALGWPPAAPYDAIVVAAGAPHVPRILIDQLAHGGKIVMPVGPRSSQELIRVTKTSYGVALARLGPCRFVPLIGKDAWDEGASETLR